jgi:2-dehydropantoate 2-reductase
MKIAVVGSGAIGSYYGAKLAHSGSDVHFLMRGDLSQVRRDGIFVRGEGENFQVKEIHCYNSTTEIGPCDLVLIAVKTTSNAEIVDLIPPLLHERTMLLTLQNGLGSDEFLAKRFGAERILGALCYISLNHVSRTEIERFAYGRIVLGEFERRVQPRTREVAAEFERGGVECQLTDDLALEQWRKLVWNIPFNGLSVLARRDFGGILADEFLRKAALDLMHEIILAANACGLLLPADAADEQIRRTEAIRPNRPSTLLDFEAGRPMEIESIWGEPLRRARAAAAATPRLEIVYALLKSTDSARRAKVET